MKYIIMTLLVLFPLVSIALDLNEARSKGLVGENSRGYIEAIKPGPEVSALVREINEKRNEEYQSISRSNGQTIDVVEKLAAAKIISRLPSGQFYKDETGQWKQK